MAIRLKRKRARWALCVCMRAAPMRLLALILLSDTGEVLIIAPLLDIIAEVRDFSADGPR